MTAERETEENNVIENEKEDNKDKRCNGKNENNDEYDNSEEEMQTLNIYEMVKGTISMMGKLNIKLPSPTQFDGRYPQFNEWSGDQNIHTYIGVHNVNIEDITDDCTKSVTVIILGDIQDKYTSTE
eukprot:4508204-Amphidinium_carterae.1